MYGVLLLTAAKEGFLQMQLPVLGNEEMRRQCCRRKALCLMLLADTEMVMATVVISTQARRRLIGMCLSEKYEDEHEGDEQEQEL